MNHSGTKALESRRCYMRKLEISDSKQLFENVYSDKKVSGYMSWDTYSDEAQVVDYLRKWQEYYDQNEWASYHIASARAFGGTDMPPRR